MKKNLLFISPRFLFPADSGGKIRTGQILRGLKGGDFRVTLVSPAPIGVNRFEDDIRKVCDHFISWKEMQPGRFHNLIRMRHIFSPIPIPVLTDMSQEATRIVTDELDRQPDVVVFDFPHSAIFAPENIRPPSVMFTHNVEAEIFHRHTKVAGNPVSRMIWKNQYQKMLRFEHETLSRFDTVIAVSEKDADFFRNAGLNNVQTIPTGTDLDFYAYSTPKKNKTIVFTGSMDWSANIDGISYMIDSIWPALSLQEPDVKLVVVGRNPPPQLVSKVDKLGYNIKFTGFVDDVRPFVWDAAAYIIPLRVGSGTRIKAFEAMAMGCPVVSTSLGVEGLDIEPDKHYLNADNPKTFSQAIIRLLRDPQLGTSISENARKLVENKFSSEVVANRFSEICLNTCSSFAGSRPE